MVKDIFVIKSMTCCIKTPLPSKKYKDSTSDKNGKRDVN